MVIEINKDIDRYQESVALGLSAKQLIFSVASLVSGAGLVLLLYRYIGLTASAYVTIPVVAPIALGGFYSYHGMSFYEVMIRKFRYSFMNQALVYESTECENAITALYNEKSGNGKVKASIHPKNKNSLIGKVEEHDQQGKQEEFEQIKHKFIMMAVGCVVAVIAAVLITVVLK